MELKRRFGWEFNGMRLHELYFENIVSGGKELSEDAPLRAAIEKEFGSMDQWLKDFQGTGSMRGIGWVILYFDPETGRLFNMWINEHDQGHGAGLKPLLVMDVFEHAFITQYGLKKAEYIQAFLKVIDWTVVSKRTSE
jgi:Fe-Mn family superoxide dismutase